MEIERKSKWEGRRGCVPEGEGENERPLEREKRCVLLQETSCGEDLSLTCLKVIANTDSIGTISVSYKIEIWHKLTKCCSRLT